MTPEDWWEIIELSDEDTTSVVCHEANSASQEWLRHERKLPSEEQAATIRELRQWIRHATGWFVDPFTEKNK